MIKTSTTFEVRMHSTAPKIVNASDDGLSTVKVAATEAAVSSLITRPRVSQCPTSTADLSVTIRCTSSTAASQRAFTCDRNQPDDNDDDAADDADDDDVGDDDDDDEDEMMAVTTVVLCYCW